MSCRRAREIDVEAFLIESGDEAQAEFRAHFPDCADCSAVVARWSAFDLALRSIQTPDGFALATHPSVEQLERLVDAPLSQAAEEIATRSHVYSCAQCQTEMNLLSRFDPAFLADAVEAARRSPLETNAVGEHTSISILAPIRRFFDSIGESVQLNPAAIGGLAFAMILVLGIWLVDGFGGDPEQPIEKVQVAERSAPPTTIESIELAPRGESTGAAEMHSEIEDEPGQRLAVEPPVEVPRRSAPPQLAQAEENEAGSTRQPQLSRVDPQEGRKLESEENEAREEILLAALTDLPLPIYDTPSGVDGSAWTQQFGPVRGGGIAWVQAQAPDHVGLTLSSAPTLWWSLDTRTELPIQVTVVANEAIEPLLRADLVGPHAAGLHSISLAEHGVELETDREYRWFVTIVVDPDRPSRNLVSGGAIRVVPEADSRRDAIIDWAVDAERGHRLAESGIWYDAYDFFASLSLAHPEVASLDRYRRRMLELARTTR